MMEVLILTGHLLSSADFLFTFFFCMRKIKIICKKTKFSGRKTPFIMVVVGFFHESTLVSRITDPVRLFSLRKNFQPVCLIRDYCLLLKIPCTFSYFWNFIPCCTLIWDSRLFRTLEYV